MVKTSGNQTCRTASSQRRPIKKDGIGDEKAEILLRKQELEKIRLDSELKDQLRREEMNKRIQLMKLENERKENEMKIENESTELNL